MTSNIGASVISSPKPPLGFSSGSNRQKYVSQQIAEELKHFFKPEFLNRIDETITFRPLDDDDLLRISDKLLCELADRLRSNGIKFVFSPAVSRFVCERAKDAAYGARPLRRGIQTLLEDSLAEELLTGRLRSEQGISADVCGGKILFSSL